MKIKIKEKDKEKNIDVDIWSIVKACFVGGLIINLLVFAFFLVLGVFFSMLVI